MPLSAARTPRRSRSSTTATAAPPTRSPTGSSASGPPPRKSPRRRSSRSGAAAPASTAPAAASAPGCSASSATGRSTSCAASAGKAPKLTFDDDAMLEQRPAEERTDEEALRRETASEIRGALGQLPGEQSKVIELAYFGGFSHSEIARMLGRAAGHREGKDEAGLGEDPGRAGGGTGMNGNEHDRWSEDARRLHAGRAGARRGGRVRAPRSRAANAAARRCAGWTPAVQVAAGSGRAPRAAAGAARGG